ncbi:hypothetical protein GCM10018779_28900 [Streptomyces griseocarneus]|nr:hypothetical protein GCM10018779_28900 [Streptomyces griseocarneus]
MKAVLSGETVTIAVPAGQPEPLTATTSITILSGGGTPSPGHPVAVAGDEVARSATAAPAINPGLNMEVPPTDSRPATARRLRRSVPCAAPGQGHSFQAKW